MCNVSMVLGCKPGGSVEGRFYLILLERNMPNSPYAAERVIALDFRSTFRCFVLMYFNISCSKWHMQNRVNIACEDMNPRWYRIKPLTIAQAREESRNPNRNRINSPQSSNREQMITVTSVAIDQFRQFDNISFCHDDTWHIDCVKLQEFFVFDTLNALMFPCNWIDDDRRYWFDGQTIQLNYAYNTHLININIWTEYACVATKCELFQWIKTNNNRSAPAINAILQLICIDFSSLINMYGWNCGFKFNANEMNDNICWLNTMLWWSNGESENKYR